MGQKDLAIFLSKLDVFPEPDFETEQYPTDSDIAAEILWFAYMNDDIENKVIADLGAGTGILGIGCLLLGAKKVIFVEKDKKAIEVLRKNLKTIDHNNYSIINKDIQDFDKKVDVVIQNPPFGTKEKHADLDFVKKATNTAKIIYSFHKAETKKFIDQTFTELKFSMTHYFEFDFPLKNTMEHHKKRLERIKVGCWRCKRNNGSSQIFMTF